MSPREKDIAKYLEATYPGFAPVGRRPRWFRDRYWRPSFLLRDQKRHRWLAVDVILSAEVPKYQYKTIVAELLDERPDLTVIVVTLEEAIREKPDTVKLCERLNAGLKILIPGVGIQTVLRTGLDPEISRKDLPTEEGWFPSAILRRAEGLKNLVFGAVIDKFVEDVRGLGNDEAGTERLVVDTVGILLQSHPGFGQNLRQLMKLSHFEHVLRLVAPKASEHVFHSFRVFLAGCPVIDRFYGHFLDAHRRFCIGPEDKMCVEYTWLLTAMFHDIGRPKEGAGSLIREELDDEDLEITVTGKNTRWQQPWYQTARRTLGSLAAFVAGATPNDRWDGGTVEDEEASRTSTDWVAIYDAMRSHAVISAFDFLADIFHKMAAGNARNQRPFVVTHAVPAALAILLHDWKIWTDAHAWGLHPLDGNMLPMGALLVYIDTWDDYKRKGSDPLVHIKDYVIDSTNVEVLVEWGNTQDLANEKKKYSAFRKAIKGTPFGLRIRPGMSGEV